MKPRKRALLLLPVLVLLGLAVFWFLRWEQENGSGSIFLSGNIELRTVHLAFKVPGKVIELKVEEGDFLEKGQVVARLDAEELLRQRDQAQAALAASKSRIRELEAALEFQTESVEAQIQQRQAERDQARLVLAELLSGSREQEIEEARAALRRAQAEAARAAGDWERAQILYRNQDISTAQYDQFRSASQATAAAVNQAEERLDLIVEGPRREDIEAARAQVDRAQAGVRMAEALRLDLKRVQQSIRTAAAEVERSRAQVAVIEEQLNNTVIQSPLDGVVLVKSAEEGEVLAAGTPVVEIGDLNRPWLRGYLGEEDLGRVKVGTAVRLRNDSFPGKRYPGRISFIASEAEFIPKQIQTTEERVKLVYRIKVEVENPDHELKLNMPVDAEILLGSAGDEARRPAGDPNPS